MRELVRKLLPLYLRRARRDYLVRRQWKSFEKLPPKEAFQRVYQDGIWGVSPDPDDRFFSGSASHTPEFVAAYVAGVEKFLRTFPEKPDVVDLGCGDFAVGAQVRPLCATYIACDVVEPLITRNRERFASLDIDFRLLDISADPLPPGEVAFLRQVLQHLSNRQIQSTIAKIPGAYRYLVLTEHLPASETFVPNIDKPVGPQTRLDAGRSPSGVVLTEPPFNLTASRSRVLCEVRDYLGLIRTTLYEFAGPRRRVVGLPSRASDGVSS
jgi:hypothetical protein